MWKDGPYLLWACVCGHLGLANGPIGHTRPYLTTYPLHLSSSSETLTVHNMPLNDVLDQHLSFPTNQVTSDVLSIAKIAIACLQTIPQSRPTMKQVSQDLSTWKPCLAKPLHMITLGEIVMSEVWLFISLFTSCSPSIWIMFNKFLLGQYFDSLLGG